MTVNDNLLVGAENRTTAPVIRRIGGLLAGLIGVAIGDQRSHARRVDEVVDLLGLADVRAAPAGTLSTGTLRLVELGRALCHDPQVLLLDEPASGLDTVETEELQRVLRDVAATGVAVLLVEHDVDLVFDIADRVYAMAEGRLIAAGSADEVRNAQPVREAYLDVEPGWPRIMTDRAVAARGSRGVRPGRGLAWRQSWRAARRTHRPARAQRRGQDDAAVDDRRSAADPQRRRCVVARRPRRGA